MIRLTVNDEALVRAFRAAPDITAEEIGRGITIATLLIEREVKERTPTSGAGTLRDSIGALPVEIGAGPAVSGGVGTANPYAAPVEFGSRPHRPPVEPLIDWVRRKLGKSPQDAKPIAEAIAWKIAHHGTEGAHMFEAGFTAVRPQVEEILADALANALDRIAAS